MTSKLRLKKYIRILQTMKSAHIICNTEHGIQHAIKHDTPFPVIYT